MKKIIILLISLITLSLTTAAQARNGIYMTGEGGWANQSGLPSKEDVHANSTSTQNFSAWRVSAGYNHDLSCAFGLGFEVGYGQYGKQTYHFRDETDTTIRSKNLEFLFAGQFHLINNFDLIGKVGGLRQTMSITGKGDQDSQIRPEVGIGGAYNFTPHFAAIVNYDHVFGQSIRDIKEIGNSTPSLNQVLVGIRGTF